MPKKKATLKKKGAKKGGAKKKKSSASSASKPLAEDAPPPEPQKTHEEIVAEHLELLPCHVQLDFKIVRGNASAVEAMMSADNFSQTYTTFDTVGDVVRDVSERLHLLPQDVTLYREHDDIAKASGEAAEQPAETVAHKWRRFAIKAGVDEEKLPFRDVPLELPVDARLADVGIGGGMKEEPLQVPMWCGVVPKADRKSSYYDLEWLM